MRGYLPDYKCITANSLSHAIDLLGSGARPIAGGTDVMVLLDAGMLPPGNYVNILNLKELQGIKVKKNEVQIGSLTTYSELRTHQFLLEQFREK